MPPPSRLVTRFLSLPVPLIAAIAMIVSALLFAVSNEGAGQGMVQDIERGYFDKLMVTPASRLSLVLGAMGGNFARITFQGLVVTVLALLAGGGLVFKTGLLGVVPMVLMASLWGVAFAALGIGVALRTGSGQATQGAQFLAFPLMFLTTTSLEADTPTARADPKLHRRADSPPEWRRATARIDECPSRSRTSIRRNHGGAHDDRLRCMR